MEGDITKRLQVVHRSMDGLGFVFCETRLLCEGVLGSIDHQVIGHREQKINGKAIKLGQEARIGLGEAATVKEPNVSPNTEVTKASFVCKVSRALLRPPVFRSTDDTLLYPMSYLRLKSRLSNADQPSR